MAGYHGKGTLKYLTATVASDDILFLPKEMMATADNFDMAEERNGTECKRRRAKGTRRRHRLAPVPGLHVRDERSDPPSSLRRRLAHAHW